MTNKMRTNATLITMHAYVSTWHNGTAWSQWRDGSTMESVSFRNSLGFSVLINRHASTWTTGAYGSVTRREP